MITNQMLLCQLQDDLVEKILFLSQFVHATTINRIPSKFKKRYQNSTKAKEKG